MPSFLTPKWQADVKMFAFAPEWGWVMAMAFADLVLAAPTAMRFHLDTIDGCVLLLPLAALAVTARKLGSKRLADTMEYLALMGAGSLAMCVATYIGWAYAGPLWDGRFDALDRAMGFDWLGWYHMIAAHPKTAGVLEFLYANVGYQTLYFCILMGVMGNTMRMREIFRFYFISLVLTAIIASHMPAMGALPTHGLKGAFPFAEKARLHLGGPLNFSLDQLTGVVTFPSFHVVMILGFCYAFRGTGLVGWLITAVNMATLPGVPVFGGHYLADMIAGAGIFAVSVAAVRFAPQALVMRQIAGLRAQYTAARQPG